jgi:UPF0271 protein
MPEPKLSIYQQCIRQVTGLTRAAADLGLAVRYLKPHGAMYNQAATNPAFANIVCSAAASLELPVIGLPGSEMERMSRKIDLKFIPEGFADRRYRPDGSLVPRTEPDAFVYDHDEAVKQVEWLIGTRGVRTICVHGDNPQAVTFAKAVREALLARGFTLKPFV